MNILVLTAQCQGQKLMCFWSSITKSIEFKAADCQYKFHTGFGLISRSIVVNLTENLEVEVSFRKLTKDKVGIIFFKIKGVILKAQAIEVTTGAKISMSSISYQQLIK